MELLEFCLRQLIGIEIFMEIVEIYLLDLKMIYVNHVGNLRFANLLNFCLVEKSIYMFQVAKLSHL